MGCTSSQPAVVEAATNNEQKRKTKKVLIITASAQNATLSNSRKAADLFKNVFESKKVKVIERDVVRNPLPPLDESYVSAIFSHDPSDAEKERVMLSNELVLELKSVDYLLISTPMYNFSLPASLKLYLDHIARAGLTFHYEDGKPVGHLGHIKGHVIMSSGGVPPGSPMDHVSVYLRQLLGFIGIEDKGLTYVGMGSPVEGVNVSEVVNKFISNTNIPSFLKNTNSLTLEAADSIANAAIKAVSVLKGKVAVGVTVLDRSGGILVQKRVVNCRHQVVNSESATFKLMNLRISLRRHAWCQLRMVNFFQWLEEC